MTNVNQLTRTKMQSQYANVLSRLLHLILWDAKFQAKYGFYFLYAVLSAVYIVVIFAFPSTWKEKTATILIFSDPASMGLFFMGAIVLLEKSQHTPSAIAVSPISECEYVTSKVLSLCVIGELVACVLALASGVKNLPLLMLGTFLASMIFSLLGIIITTKIESLNQFIVATVPVEIFCFVPPLLHLFGVTPNWLKYFPVNVCMDFISGKDFYCSGLFVVTIVIFVLFVIAKNCVHKMWFGVEKKTAFLTKTSSSLTRIPSS